MNDLENKVEENTRKIESNYDYIMEWVKDNLLEGLEDTKELIKKLESEFKEFKGDKHIFSEIWKVYTKERIPWETSVLERLNKFERWQEVIRTGDFDNRIRRNNKLIENVEKPKDKKGGAICCVCGLTANGGCGLVNNEMFFFCVKHLPKEKLKDSELLRVKDSHVFQQIPFRNKMHRKLTEEKPEDKPTNVSTEIYDSIPKSKVKLGWIEGKPKDSQPQKTWVDFGSNPKDSEPKGLRFELDKKGREIEQLTKMIEHNEGTYQRLKDGYEKKIVKLKKDLPLLLSCLNVLKSSGISGHEMKRSLEIVEEMKENG